MDLSTARSAPGAGPSAVGASDELVRPNQIFLRQKKDWSEIVFNLEARNAYEVFDAQRTPLGYVAEESGGIGTKIWRYFARTHRGFTVHVFDPARAPILKLWRKFFFLFSSLYVEDAGGRRLGEVQRRFGVLYKRYDLHDESGVVFARIRSPRWRLWTFPVLSGLAADLEVATISKKWGGAVHEFFTEADTFLIEFKDASLSPNQRKIVFAAAISVDFDFFEENTGFHLTDFFDWGN